jgi:hypothetical protein
VHLSSGIVDFDIRPLSDDARSQGLDYKGSKMAQIPAECIGLAKQKRAYVIADNKIAQNSAWNDEFLRLELADLWELGAKLELLGFNPMEIAGITLGKDVDFKEYDESAADDVEMRTRPECGKSFPK